MPDEFDRWIEDITGAHADHLLRNTGTATPEQMAMFRRAMFERYGLTVTNKSAFVWNDSALYFAEELPVGEPPRWTLVIRKGKE